MTKTPLASVVHRCRGSNTGDLPRDKSSTFQSQVRNSAKFALIYVVNNHTITVLKPALTLPQFGFV